MIAGRQVPQIKACTRTSPNRLASTEFVERQAQKRCLGPQGSLCFAGTRSGSFLAARWLAYSSTAEPPLSLTNVLLKVNNGSQRVKDLATILLCSETGLVRMARRFPGILNFDPDEIFYRLIDLKTELPRCDVAGMVHGQPVLFLSRPSKEVATQVATTYSMFSQELPHMDVDTVVQEQPATLFIDKDMLMSGLPELRLMTHPSAADSTTIANLLWAIYGRNLEDEHNQAL